MNPGLFPAGTTPEDYLDGNQKASGSRNPNLAQALFRGGYIEAFGSGVRRIKEACDAAGVKVEYRQYNDETTVVFHRPGSQVEYVAAGPEASANTDALPDPAAIHENETRKRDAKTRREAMKNRRRQRLPSSTVSLRPHLRWEGQRLQGRLDSALRGQASISASSSRRGRLSYRAARVGACTDLRTIPR